MAFCTQCGAGLDGTTRFCTSCGQAIAHSAAPTQAARPQQPAAPTQAARPQQPAAPTQAARPLQPAAPTQVARPLQQPAPPAPQPAHRPGYQHSAPAKKKSRKPLVVGGIIGVLVLGLVAVLVFTNAFGLLGSFGVNSPFLRNYDWDNFDPADFIEPLGDATFAVDYENSDTGEFLADGKTPLILSVTDNAGAVWTLEVPANALLSPETLTMTVLRDVRLAGEGLDGGVLLSPSGLAFFEPAMLRVTGEGCGEDSVIYEGAHDGRNMSITEYEAGEGYVCATVWHFSTRTKASGKGGGASVSMLQLLVDMGNEILRQPLSAPEPPSSTFKCPEYHNTDNAALRAYSSKVADPELVAIQTIQRALANYRGKDALVAQAMDMVVKLEERFADKVNMLIYQYRGQEDKFMAISMLAFYSGNRDTLKGGIDYEEIYSWGKEVWNELMQELVEGHDYTRAHSLRQLKTFIVFICTLRDVPIDADAFDQKLSNALTFWVEWELHTDTIGLVIMESSSEALVSMEQQTGEAGLSGDGTGDGRIDNYSVGDDRKAKPQVSFSVNARLSNLDPCMSNSITVGLDNPGATDFDVVFDTTGRSEYKEFLVQRAFEDKLDEGFYTFELPLINLQEKCAEKKESGKYEESGATFTADITISLYHAPKDDVYIN